MQPLHPPCPTTLQSFTGVSHPRRPRAKCERLVRHGARPVLAQCLGRQSGLTVAAAAGRLPRACQSQGVLLLAPSQAKATRKCLSKLETLAPDEEYAWQGVETRPVGTTPPSRHSLVSACVCFLPKTSLR